MKNNQNIVFVTGASRSGTTMLNNVLGRNSRIFGLKEMHYFGGLVDVDRLDEVASIEDSIKYASIILSRQASGLWGGDPTAEHIEQAKQLIEEYPDQDISYGEIYSYAVKYLAENENMDIVSEQTPRNIFYGDTLLSTYSKSKIVHVVRDPRAVLASQKAKWCQKKLGAHKIPLLQVLRVWINYHPITMSKLWVKANAASLKLAQSDRVKVILYEDFVSNPEKILAEICEFLDVKFEKEMLNITSMGSSYVKSKKENKGISKAAIGRWKDTLSKGEINICENFTDNYMRKFSYQRVTESIMFITIIPQLITYPLHLLGVILTNPGRLWIQLKAMSRVDK